MPDPGAARGGVRSAAQVDRAADAGWRAPGRARRVRRDRPRPVADERRPDRPGERVHPRAGAPQTMRAVSGRKMRICVVGAGAVGGLIGAWCARAGHEVCLVARGAHLEALRRDGLTLLSNGNRSVFPIPSSDDPADFGTQDAVFVCLKTHSIAAMVPRLKTLVGPDTMVVPAINGLPWWYFFKEGGRLDGRPIDCLAPAMNAAGFEARVAEDIRVDIWTKLIGNLSYNPVAALALAHMDDINGNPALLELIRVMMEEAMRVADAYGVRVPMTVGERIGITRK